MYIEKISDWTDVADIDRAILDLKRRRLEILEPPSNSKAGIVHGVKKLILDMVTFPEQYKKFTLRTNIEKIFNYSSDHVCRVFHESEGMTINGYLKKERANRMKELITDNPSMPLSMIANKSGYSDRNYADIEFKNIIGVTTAQFRKQLTEAA